MKKHFDCLVVGGSWSIPVPPMHEDFLLDALVDLKAACAGTSRRLFPAAGRQRFEREAIVPVYCQVQRELEWLLRSWGMAVSLPEFAGAKPTAEMVQQVCCHAARSFEPGCSLQHAARACCLLWTLRRVGVELLPHVWADESFSWFDRLGPQSYSDSTEFPAGVWDLATGRETATASLVKPLGRLCSSEGRVIRDPAPPVSGKLSPRLAG